MDRDPLEKNSSVASIKCLQAPSARECQEIKELTLKRLSEYGFETIPALDSDLDNLAQVYIEGGGAVFVAKVKGQTIGTVLLKNKGVGVGEIKRFQVSPEYRGLGIGKRLLSEALVFLRKHRFQKAILDTTEKSTAAISLFRDAGFVETRHDGSQIFFELSLSVL